MPSLAPSAFGAAKLDPSLREQTFVAVADDARHAFHGGKFRRRDGRGAAGDDDARVGAFAMQAADGLARLARRLRRDGAGVDDDKIFFPGAARLARERLRFDDVEPAAEGDRLDRGAAHVANPSKMAGSSVVSNSNSTGPVICA